MTDCGNCALRRDVDLMAEEMAELRRENYRLLNELNAAREQVAPFLGAQSAGECAGECGNCGGGCQDAGQ